MKTVAIFVTSLDGKITKWGDHRIRLWSSKEDQVHFDSIWNDTRVIVMGSGTYDPDPVKPSGKHLFVVLTRSPSRYSDKEQKGKLVFTNERPEKIIERFEKEGEERILIVGGSQIASLFLKNQLIDELWLTFEPSIFGTGGNFIIDEKLDIKLRLLSCEKVNIEGTLIAKYLVIKI